MRDLFPGFYDPTNEEITQLWQEGIFVFDTNMLLNVYRYSSEARDRFFEILDRLKDRIWIPYQVALEYQDNRMEVIEQQLKAYGEVSSAIKNASKILGDLNHLKGKHSFIKVDELTEAPKKALGVANEKLSAEQVKYKKEFEDLKAYDDRREKIAQLFQGRVGTPYSKDRLLEVYRQADVRFGLQIPPGWKDRRKRGSRRSAFSATSSDFRLVRSVRVPSSNEVFDGLVQCKKLCWSM